MYLRGTRAPRRLRQAPLSPTARGGAA